MKFKEAMEAMTQGHKVTRSGWSGSIYFAVDEGKVKAYQPVLTEYFYNQDILISDGWAVIDHGNGTVIDNLKFYEIIPYLQLGNVAKLNTWKDAHIYYDNKIKKIIVKQMNEFEYHYLELESFIAEDWIYHT